MELCIELPGWLEACRPEDALSAGAYENAAPELRALLKTALAFAFHRWPGQDGVSARSSCSLRSGFRHTDTLRPAAWVLACAGPGYASPARFLACLVPALAAGTGRIAVVSEQAFSPALCTAMELAGLEDSFVLGGDRLADVYEDLRAVSSDGRLLLFPGADGTFSPAQKSLLHGAAADGLPVLRDRPSPRLLSLYASGPDAEALAARLRWLHPDAELLTEAAAGVRAAYVPDEKTKVPASPDMILGPGMEACWPGPAPDFFRSSACSAYLFQETSACFNPQPASSSD